MFRIRFFVIVLLFLGVQSSLIFAQGDMAIQAGNVTGAPGGEVLVPIDLIGAANIGGAHVEIVYDPDILRVNRVDDKASGLIQHEVSQPGRIIVGWVTAETLDGNIEIVDVIFDIVADQGEQAGITLENASILDATTMQEMPVATTNGSVEIISGESNGGSNVGLWAMIIIVAVVLIGLVLFLFTQRAVASSNTSLNTLAGSVFPASLALNKELIVLGRDQGCDIVINDELASRQHAQISRQGEAYQIVDMNSSNGTKVNGANIRSHQLSSGSIIEIGDTRIQFIQQ